MPTTVQRQADGSGVVCDTLPAWGSLPRVGVAVLVGRNESQLFEVAAAWAAFLCPGTVASDLRVAAPSGPSWTVEEIDELIVKPSSLAPATQHVIVVARADAMPYADRLLKVVEEPPAATLWILCAADADALTVTMRSRATHIIEVRAAPPAGIAATLSAAGVDAVAALEVFAPVDDLLESMALHAPGELAACLEQVDGIVAAPSALTAAELCRALAALAATSAVPDVPAKRRVQRACLAAVHARFTEQLAVALRNGASPDLVAAAAVTFDRSSFAVAHHARLDAHLASSAVALRTALNR